MQLCNENIETLHVMPGLLIFEHDCLTILRQSLLAVAPQEGCALLLGQRQKSFSDSPGEVWNINLIWPCCNVWQPDFFPDPNEKKAFDSKSLSRNSKKNRFSIDPREQIAAQKWARGCNLQVLGTAHSHPTGNAMPSATDIRWGFSIGILVIVGQSNEVRGWLKQGNNHYSIQEITLTKQASNGKKF